MNFIEGSTQSVVFYFIFKGFTMNTVQTKVIQQAAKRRELKKNLIAYSFIAPNFIGFAIFTLGPIVFAFILAFLEWNGSKAPMVFVGLKNITRLFIDSTFHTALWNTILYSLGTVPLTMIFALFLAIILNQKVYFRNFFRTVSFFPYVASLVAVAVVWNMIFNPAKGPVNLFLTWLLNLSEDKLPGWAADKHWAMITVIMFSVWKNMGYYMVIYLAGLQGISPELYEASDLDGVTRLQKFRYITLPQLSATTFFVSVMLIIDCFKVYDQIYMITQGGPGTSTLVLVYHIYNTAFISWNLGYASSVAIVLFILVLTITLIQFQTEKKISLH